MSADRRAIPRPLARAVLVEAGHRCAIPTCRATTTELAHIVPWADVREHTFENLIALCPNCHSRYDKGEIDRQSMVMYKRNLGLVSSRYGDDERRLLDLFAKAPPNNRVAQFTRDMDWEFMYLLQDGLINKTFPPGGYVMVSGVRQGPVLYVLTDQGSRFVDRLRAGDAVEDTEQPE